MKLFNARTILTITATFFVGYQSSAEPSVTSTCELKGEAIQMSGEVDSMDSVELKTEMNAITALQLYNVKDALNGGILVEDSIDNTISFKLSDALIKTVQSSGSKVISMVQSTATFSLPTSADDSRLPINTFKQMESKSFLIAYNLSGSSEGKSLNLYIAERKSTNGSTPSRKMKLAISKNGQTIEKELVCSGVKFTHED